MIAVTYDSFAEIDLSKTRIYQNNVFLGYANKEGLFYPSKKLKGELRVEHYMCLPVYETPGVLGKNEYFNVELEVREFVEQMQIVLFTTFIRAKCGDTTEFEYEADEPAVFPGGNNELQKFLSERIIYPESAVESGYEGTVYIGFMVSESGIPDCIQLIRGVKEAPELGEEALRVVRELPAFQPAILKGKPIKSILLLPVVFKFG